MEDMELEPFTIEERIIIELSKEFFWFFLDNVFLKSFEGQTYTHDDGTQREFEFGDIHREWAILAQYNPRLCLMAPRAHLKSTVLSQAFAFWHMFRVEEGEFKDILYFSYKAELAGEQVEGLSKLIQANPYCRYWRDLKKTSNTVIDYLIDFGEGTIGETTMKGAGIMGATRGRHPKVTICDDILSDFSNPLSSSDLIKINRIFRQAIMSLPANPDDPLLLVGTPQSYDDILYSLAKSDEWMWITYPAIIDEKNKLTQWPEKFTYERLKAIQKSHGANAFEVEYQLTPIRATDQFFTRDEILSVVDERLNQRDLLSRFPDNDLAVYAGLDVGKKVHPSHVVVFLEMPNGTLIQIYQMFLDGYRYNTQVKLLNRIAEVFDITRGYYDNTNNVMDDRGLSHKWIGKHFSAKLKNNMATQFEKRVFAGPGEPGILLLNNQRQINQIVAVNKLLKAEETIEGHGDSFWSISLAIQASLDGPGILEIGSPVTRIGSSYNPSQMWARQFGGR